MFDVLVTVPLFTYQTVTAADLMLIVLRLYTHAHISFLPEFKCLIATSKADVTVFLPKIASLLAQIPPQGRSYY